MKRRPCVYCGYPTARPHLITCHDCRDLLRLDPHYMAKFGAIHSWRAERDAAR